MIVEYSLVSDIGKTREINQDDFCFFGKTRENRKSSFVTVTEQNSFVAVFDGIGGMQHGETASKIIATTVNKHIANKFPTDELMLGEMALASNEKLCIEMKRTKIKCGSTLSMLLISEGMYYICNIGDSPIFLLRKGKLSKISIDHIELVNYEKIAKTESKNSHKDLTQYIGISPDEMILEPYLAKGEIERGDKFILCTDGLPSMVPHEDIEFITSNCNIAHEIAKQLVNKALENGGTDNITVVCAVVQ